MLHQTSAISPRAALVIFIFSIVVFALVAILVSSGLTLDLDRAIMVSLRDQAGAPIGPHWLTEAAIEVTTLGGWPLLTLFSFVIGGYFLIRRQYDFAIILLTVIIGHSVLVSGLKELFARTRPDFAPHLVEATSASFPSGHSASAAAVYLTLGLMAANLGRERSFKFYAIAAGISIATLIGLSRIWLGVHFPSDVVAGWAVGSGWASLVWLVAWRLTNNKAR